MILQAVGCADLHGITTVTMVDVQKQKKLIYVVVREGFEKEVGQCGVLVRAGDHNLGPMAH